MKSEESTKAFLNQTFLKNQTNGSICSLADLTKSDEHRMNEILMISKAFENDAISKNYCSVFFTLTCPTEMHPNSKKYDGTTPKEASDWLQKQWRNIQKRLGENNINITGLWSKEPHSDACPDMHLLAYYEHKNSVGMEILAELNKAQKEAKKGLYNKLRKPILETNTVEALFLHYISHSYVALDIQFIDSSKGESPTTYITKYLMKSLCIKEYQETEIEDDKFKRIEASSKLWAYRRYGFFGNESKLGIFREFKSLQFILQRSEELKSTMMKNETFRRLYNIVLKNDFKSFMREDLSKVYFIEDISKNIYGEDVTRIAGIGVDGECFIRPRWFSASYSETLERINQLRNEAYKFDGNVVYVQDVSSVGS